MVMSRVLCIGRFFRNSDSRLGFALLYPIRSRILIFNPDEMCGSNADANSNIRRPRHRFRPQDVSIIRKDQVKSLFCQDIARLGAIYEQAKTPIVESRSFSYCSEPSLSSSFEYWGDRDFEEYIGDYCPSEWEG